MTTATLPTRGDLQAAAAADRGLTSVSWRALGTSVQLVVPTDGLAGARAAVERVLAEVDQAASRFRPDSELSWIRPGEWCPVSSVLHGYLAAALHAAEWTGGLVDPTVGQALISLGYNRTFRLVPAEGPAISVSVRQVPGWSSIGLEPDRVLVPLGATLDLGATAKGLAADHAAERAAAVAGSALVSLGGDMAVAGETPDGGWPVLVADKADPELVDVAGQVVVIASGGLATSGTASRRWRRGDRVLHHLIDPRTSTPTAGPWQTVSVVASSCLLANTASTAAMVLGVDAVGWLRQHSFSARLVGLDGGVATTGDWPAEDAA